MAKQQYRITGELEWTSNSGNALLAIINKNASGKKLTLRSLEVTPVTSSTTGTAGSVSAAAATILGLAQATVAGGESVTPVALDTSASAWPSTARVLKRATVSSPTVFGSVYVLKQLNQASASWFGRQSLTKLSRMLSRPRLDADIQSFTVAAGESVALYARTLNNTVPVRVTATIIRAGTPKRCFSVHYFTGLRAADEAIFALVNDGGSGETFYVRDLAVEEVGTFDSPYLQLVPVGGLVEAEAASPVSVVKLDTDYPSHSSYMDVRANCPLLPFGVPEDAFALSSAGSPKGFNYLKTKDFLGPVYRVLFPEYVTARPGAMPDAITARCPRLCDVLVQGSGGIVIREGEGVALVSAAETAAGATAAVAVSGWSCFEFSAVVDIEPAQIPIISATGIVDGSRYRVERVSDNSLVTTGVAGVSGTFSYEYTVEDTPLDLRLRVRKASSAPFYKSYEVEFNLTSAGVTIPVSQIPDD